MFALLCQGMVAVIVGFVGLIIGEFAITREVNGVAMTNSQMESYLSALPMAQEVLERDAANLERELLRLEDLQNQMAARIEQAATIATEEILEERQQKIEELSARNAERIEARIQEIEAKRDQRLQEIEALYEDIQQLQAKIGGIQS